MRAAALSAQNAGKPWTLDPVAVGALTLRSAFCHELLSLQPAAIRGNASEIMALAGMSAGGRGSIPPIPPRRRCPPHRRWRGRSIPLSR
jgi:hydroxyethylthiazole kinase